MADRLVTHVSKTENGDVVALGNPGEAWSPRTKAEIVGDIDNGAHTYYVTTNDRKRAGIVVVSGALGKYLFTDQDGPAARYLLSLPDLEQP